MQARPRGPVAVDALWSKGSFGALRGRLGALAATVDRLLFPMACQVCGGDGLEGAFCGECRRALLAARGPACPRCALPVGPHALIEGGCSKCRGRALGFDAALALGMYEGPVREICLKLKRGSNAWLARWTADLMFDAFGEALREQAACGVTYVPLHWRRRFERGYNQAEAVAARLAKRLDLRLVRPLRRVRRTPKLSGIGRVERAELMRGAFRVKHGAKLGGARVLLIDDVLTTGATCGAAARALRKAGASGVTAIVVARAEGRV